MDLLFYGLLDRMVPCYAQEQVGLALLEPRVSHRNEAIAADGPVMEQARGQDRGLHRLKAP